MVKDLQPSCGNHSLQNRGQESRELREKHQPMKPTHPNEEQFMRTLSGVFCNKLYQNNTLNKRRGQEKFVRTVHMTFDLRFLGCFLSPSISTVHTGVPAKMGLFVLLLSFSNFIVLFSSNLANLASGNIGPLCVPKSEEHRKQTSKMGLLGPNVLFVLFRAKISGVAPANQRKVSS